MASSTTRATTASPQAPQGLTCEFTMPSCQHASIFNDVYLRTNRTNHTKIMRCFPHCCPEHRRRSYCGSSIHLKVQPKASKSDDKLVVYARFRPVHVEPMPIGSIISLQAIQSSLQSKDPSKGEWIECVPVKPAKGAPPTTESMYEVNPSGRWYYPWSGAATIAMRATEHVFEALVFRRSGPKQLELVSFTVSSLFRLMSFRRGLPTATKAGAEGSDESPRNSPQKLKSAPRAASPTGRLFSPNPLVQMPWASTSEPHPQRTPLQPQSGRHDHALYSQYPGDRRRSHEYAFPSIQLPARGSFLRPTSAPDSFTHRIYEGQQRHRSPEVPAAPATNTMEALMQWLHEMHASSAGSRSMLAWQTIVQQACEAQVTASHQVASVRAGLVPILSALDIATAGKAAMPTARLTGSAAFGSHGPASPLDSMDAAVRVLLHEWLDVDCTRASSGAMERVVLNGFIPTREEFAAAHDEWLGDVVARAQRYVHAHTRASWSQLTATISRLADNRQQLSIPEGGSEFSHRSFVAQYRQRFMRESQRHSNASRATKRQRTDWYRVSYGSDVPQGLRNSAPVWTSRMEDLSIEMDGLSQHALSLLTLVQFWKHLSCLRLDYASGQESAGQLAQLSVASVFNALVSEGSFTKLTLDGQYRWFSCLPSGEPTVGTTLMGYVVGDYVGRATSAGTIHLTTYLWPATTETSTAYAWHWTIDASLLTSHSSSSVVSVVVESASVGRTPHAMETMSMAEKLRCVGRWHHACEVRLSYQTQ